MLTARIDLDTVYLLLPPRLTRKVRGERNSHQKDSRGD
jgi:hypothetical protein